MPEAHLFLERDLDLDFLFLDLDLDLDFLFLDLDLDLDFLFLDLDLDLERERERLGFLAQVDFTFTFLEEPATLRV